VPDAIAAICRGERLLVRNPSSVRPWQHVLEPLSGYLLLAERLNSDPKRYRGAWNFGPESADSSTVGELVSALCNRWGNGAAWYHQPSTEPHEAQFLSLDSSKARNTLGWRPRLNFDTALEWTVNWYRQQRAGENAREISQAQIDMFAGQSR
jgi:CDP-glucose 4,6-dehydratase